jgi:hypothetical protein
MLKKSFHLLVKNWFVKSTSYIKDGFHRNSLQREERRRDIERRSALLLEIAVAHTEWQSARDKLNYVETGDQIDYAVYCFETAQKRYEMLIRMAKRQQIKGSWYYR